MHGLEALNRPYCHKLYVLQACFKKEVNNNAV